MFRDGTGPISTQVSSGVRGVNESAFDAPTSDGEQSADLELLSILLSHLTNSNQ